MNIDMDMGVVVPGSTDLALENLFLWNMSSTAISGSVVITMSHCTWVNMDTLVAPCSTDLVLDNLVLSIPTILGSVASMSPCTPRNWLNTDPVVASGTDSSTSFSACQ